MVIDSRGPLNHLSVRIAVGASLVYALIAILFNLSEGVLAVLLGPYSDLFSSPLWTLKDLGVSTVVLIAVVVGVVASVISLVRHRDARLVAFLALTLSSVGLSVRLMDILRSLARVLHSN